MRSSEIPDNLILKLVVGLLIGVALALIDHYGPRGKFSAASLLFWFTFLFGYIWKLRGWPASLTAWSCLPLARLIKPFFGLQASPPAAFMDPIWMSVILTVAGTCLGFLLCRLSKIST